MDAPPSDNLYMKGLPAGVSEETLRAIFGSYGTVVSARILPAPPGLNDSAALVRMSAVEEAQWLVDNAATIAAGIAMPIQIRFAVNSKAAGKGIPAAVPQPQRGGSPSSKLYVRGLPLGISEEHLTTIMSAYGAVTSCKVLSPLAGASDAASIVQMGNIEQAQWMVDSLDGNIPQGLSTPVSVKFKSDGPAQVAAPASPLTYVAAAASGMGAATQTSSGGQPSDNLYMCGFPVGTSEEKVKTVFGAYGIVISCKVLPPPPGKSDVACLIRMGSLEEAQWLVEHVNGNIPQGMTDPISIRFADKPRTLGSCPSAMIAPQPPAPALPPQMSPSSNLYMKGFPPDTTESTLRSVFGQYGVVRSCRVMPTISGGNDVAALVQMSSVVEAQWLVDHVNGNIPQGLGVPVQIRFANNPKGAGKGNGFTQEPWSNMGPSNPRLGVKAQLPAAPGIAVTSGQPSTSLYVQGFPLGETVETVQAAIGQYGTVLACKRLTLPPGHDISAWLIQMSSVEEANWLVENLHENIPTGYTEPVEVRFYPAVAGSAVAMGRFSPY
mmetsp:Transcript_31098/g.89190  ORF Transcript_31098/g.89190 Transcript_31098/m.89190 type:complete len:550 (-) Transcript_31098:413-2062(-)